MPNGKVVKSNVRSKKCDCEGVTEKRSCFYLFKKNHYVRD